MVIGEVPLGFRAFFVFPLYLRVKESEIQKKYQILTRYEHFHGQFRLCAEYLIRSIGQK